MSKSSLPKDAEQARQKGAKTFVCRINQGFFQMSGNTPLYGIAEVIDGIKASGWELEHVTWFEDRRDHPSAFCIFKAVQPQQQVMPPMPQPAYAPPPPGYPQPFPQQAPPAQWGQPQR